MRIIALTTCHNRRDVTLRSVSDLVNQKLAANVSLYIVVVNDGSTDGTAEALQRYHPNVEVVPGSGNLYWAGGMRHGWNQSLQYKNFDALIVFNDDIILYPDAIERMLKLHTQLKREGVTAHAVAGPFIDSNTGRQTYGGLIRKKGLWPSLNFHTPHVAAKPVRCDTLNMNMALLSADSISRIGFLDKNYTHGAADIDFGLRLTSAGGEVWQLNHIVGSCPRNTCKGTSAEPGISLTERMRRVFSIKEAPPRERFVHCRRHAGKAWFLVFLWAYIKALFPNK